MLTFNNLGFLGRLGNQMFQYAALKGIATYKGYSYTIPQHPIDLCQCFNLPPPLPNNNKTTVKVNSFEFNEYFLKSCPDNVDIHGFFQSEKYFKHIESELRKDFTFNSEIKNKCFAFLNDLNITGEKIALHIRRQDYITNKNFTSLDLQYYIDALKILSNIPVIIFSDDIEWCKKQSVFKNFRFIFSFLENQYQDLCAMSMCDFHIIANSSYSWWGSWLAQSKKTIAPKQWFSGDYKQWNTKDLYLNDWIVI